MPNTHPTVSIILPTYNRLAFLPDAIEAIKSQEWQDWELIIVDDGSTDDTLKVLPRLLSGITHPVKVIEQENQGAYGARNTGLDHSNGSFVAFYDSDDLWRSHHLSDCVEALLKHQDVDWVYGACQLIDKSHNKVISSNSFYSNFAPKPFMRLPTRTEDNLKIVVGDKITCACCQIESGFFSGLQNSVIRKKVFKDYKFETKFANEAEDQIAVIRSFLSNFKVAYFDNVHVDYYIHSDNSSAVGSGADSQRQERVILAMIAGFEHLLKEMPQASILRKTLIRKISNLCFWDLGYGTYQSSANRDKQLSAYKKGILLTPCDFRKWKTFVGSFTKKRK